jgi:hypothetical protein
MDAAPIDYLVIDLRGATVQASTTVPDLSSLIAYWNIAEVRPVQITDRRD